jgi:putative transposase
MPRRIQIAPFEYYHLYQRGVDGRLVFEDEEDYLRFIVLLFFANSTERVNLRSVRDRTFADQFVAEGTEKIVDIGAYCLMPNHFHVLVREIGEGGISKYMQKLMTAYTMYFNKKYGRKGSLFGSGYRAEHVTDDRHLKYLFAYIHLNPLSLHDPNWRKKGVTNKKTVQGYLQEYIYSGYLDWCGGDRSQCSILSPESFPQYFEEPDSFSEFIQEWVSFSELEHELFKPGEEESVL